MDNNTIETMQATCQCGNSNNQSKVAAAELQHKLDLLLRTGSILMESAADTSRIRRTMKRAAAFLSLDERYLHFYINWYTLLGVLAGSNTNPSALAYVRDQTSVDAPNVGYANVYPFAMFLRIVTIQILIFVFG